MGGNIMSTDVLIKREITLEGLNCAHCAEVINEKVNKLEEIESANLNFINKVLTLNIISSFNQDDTLNIRVFSEEQPDETFIQANPILEDVYFVTLKTDHNV